ncbi:MAG TPA: PHP domain-containing protein, partial [Allosphingosinicella sp.]|nr:PHP domain-containing protein [Allosphingosinicella sp.]
MKSWIISIGAAVLVAAAPVAAQSVFFGSLHSHTMYSDGSGTPDDAYKGARKAGLDFFAITEHNHAKAEGSGEGRDTLHIATNAALYRGAPNALIETADRLDAPGRFVTLYGQEFSTIERGGNHTNVFGIQNVITVPNGRYDLLAALVNSSRDPSGQPPLVQMNHPNNPLARRPNMNDYGRNKFGGDAGWVAAMDPIVELIEVLSGPALNPGRGLRPRADETEFLGYLDLGFHLAPTSGQDNHFRNWGTSTDTRTAIIASSLTRANV